MKSGGGAEPLTLPVRLASREVACTSFLEAGALGCQQAGLYFSTTSFTPTLLITPHFQKVPCVFWLQSGIGKSHFQLSKQSS